MIRTIQEIEKSVLDILTDIKNENISSAKQKMALLFSSIKDNPSFLEMTSIPDKLGKVFILMINNRISTEDDTIEAMACIAYVLISKALLQNPNPNLYLDRLLVIEFSREQFNYSIQTALDVRKGGTVNFFSPVGQMGGTEARDGIFKMEIADLYSNPVLYQQIDILKNKKIEFDEMIARDFFYKKTLPDLIAEGKANHEKAYKYFQNKILVNQDIDI